MKSVNRAPNVPTSLIWVLVWLGVFLQTACFWLIPLTAVHRAPRHLSHALSPYAPDFSLPLLMTAVMAAALTWLTWQGRKSGEIGCRPKTNEVAAKRGRKFIIAFVGGLVLLSECMWMFGSPGVRVNWPLLAALNIGVATGWQGWWWALRLLPDLPRTTDMDPLPLPRAANAVPTAPTTVPWYSDTRRWALPEPLIGLVTALCCYAIFGLVVTPVSPSDALFFSSFGLVLALPFAVLVLKFRRDARTRLELSQNPDLLPELQRAPKTATEFYVSFSAIGLMMSLSAWGHLDWPLFLLCNAGAFVVHLLFRWTVSRPLVVAPVATPPRVPWLPERSVMRRSPTEIVFQADPWMRALGPFAILGMGGLSVLLGSMAFDWGPLGPPPPSHALFWRLVVFAFCVPCAVFTLFLLRVFDPQRLRLALDTRTYTQEAWKAVPESLGRAGFLIPFYPERLTGSIDADMAGFCLKEYHAQGNSSYVLQLVWKDKGRSPRIFSTPATPEEAQIALAQASGALNLPALGRCESGDITPSAS